jgi:pyridoxal phosphate enzyme (YggS family)
MNPATRYHQIKQMVREKALTCGRDPKEITLIAVSKTFPVEVIQAVYQEGGRDFGENRLQEALLKIPHLPPECHWHLIGTLQSNKVSKAIASFRLIHSVDNPVLARKISQASQEKGVITPILLQVNTSGEKTKHGLSGEEWERTLENVNQMSHISVEGLMTIAPYTEDQRLIRSCFHRLYLWRETWRCQMRNPDVFQHLSMGMSNDFLIAIEEGATLLRIGSAIFGERRVY